MTNLAKLLKIFNNTNINIQDIAETYEDMDKLFSIKRVNNQLPFNIDFVTLKENGFEPKEFFSATKMEAELIIQKVN